MPRIIMNRGFIARWTRMPHSTGRLSASASSHHSLSSAAFITNIAESDFRHAQGLIAVLINPNNPPSVEEGRAVESAAAALGQRLLLLQASTLSQVEDAFARIKQRQVRALMVGSDPFFFSERVKLVVLTARDALPTVFTDREQAEAGGLMSYGASRTDAYRQAATYVGRIVKGEKPADLPVTLPTKFHIVVNLKTAKSLRIDIPTTVLARADEVIE